MIPHSELHPETVDQLKNWRKPRHAYILFETREYSLRRPILDEKGKPIPEVDESGQVVKDEKGRIVYKFYEPGLYHTLFTLNVENRPEIGSKFKQYMRKGYRVIDFGNFPKSNDPDLRRAQKVKHHSGPSGENPWDTLAADTLAQMRVNPNWAAEKAEILAREKDITQKYNELLEAQNKKTRGQHERTS
ncbi:MAG: hypothetical protein KC483_02525 [Nitrosarchaeum sp.]|nr:hypothetical protein [Nitrosarchaeum sp.]